MSTLTKLARETLVPGTPGSVYTTPERVRRVARTIPIYRTYTVPIALARPGDKIVRHTVTVRASLPGGGYMDKVGWEEYAIRTELVGYNTVYETVVEPGTVIRVQPTDPTVLEVPPAWDATAWSVESLRQPLRASWKVGTFTADSVGSGVVVGLTFLPPHAGTERSHIIHGIRVEDGVAYLHNVQPAGIEPADGNGQVQVLATNVTTATVLSVSVIDGLVRFFADDVLLATQPSSLGESPVRLAAALYDPRDTVVDASLESLAFAEGEVRLRLAARGASYAYAEGAVRLQLRAYGEANKNFLRLRLYAKGSERAQGEGVVRLSVHAEGFGNYVNTGSGTATLGRIAALGSDYDYAGGTVAFVLRAYGDGGSPTTNLFGRSIGGGQFLETLATFPHRGIYARAEAGGSFSATVRRNEHMATRIRSRLAVKAAHVFFDRVLGNSLAASGLSAERLLDAAVVFDASAGAPMVGLVLISGELRGRAEVVDQLSGARVTGGQLLGQVEAGSDVEANQVLNAALVALARAGVLVHIPGANIAVWSVNADTGGSTAYEQYPFNSFACIGGRYYGAAEGGIFELVGEQDDGAPIEAFINLGKRSFGSDVLKGISNAYLAVSSAGRMRVRVTTPTGEAYTYETRRADDHMRVQRADFGRGLRAHYLGLELTNQSGADFELEAAEFLVTEMKRRI